MHKINMLWGYEFSKHTDLNGAKCILRQAHVLNVPPFEWLLQWMLVWGSSRFTERNKLSDYHTYLLYSVFVSHQD